MELEQRAILVGVNLNSQKDFDYSMEELANLTEACEVEVVRDDHTEFASGELITFYRYRKDRGSKKSCGV